MYSSSWCRELDPIGSVVSNPVSEEADSFVVGQQQFSQGTYVLSSSWWPHLSKSSLNSIRKFIRKLFFTTTWTWSTSITDNAVKEETEETICVFKLDSTQEQDCIPVGCIPPACWPYLPACTAQGVSLPEGVVSQHAMGQTPPLWTEWQTHEKNLTFANYVCGR